MAKSLVKAVTTLVSNAVSNQPVKVHVNDNLVYLYWPEEGPEERAVAVLEYETKEGFIDCYAVGKDVAVDRYKYPQHRPLKSANITLSDPQMATKIENWVKLLLEQLNQPVDA